MTRRCLWCSFTIILPKIVNVSSICHRRCCRWTSPILTKIEHHWWQSNMVEPLKMNAQHHTWHRRLARISHKILHHIFTCIYICKQSRHWFSKSTFNGQTKVHLLLPKIFTALCRLLTMKFQCFFSALFGLRWPLIFIFFLSSFNAINFCIVHKVPIICIKPHQKNQFKIKIKFKKNPFAFIRVKCLSCSKRFYVSLAINSIINVNYLEFHKRTFKHVQVWYKNGKFQALRIDTNMARKSVLYMRLELSK